MRSRKNQATLSTSSHEKLGSPVALDACTQMAALIIVTTAITNSDSNNNKNDNNDINSNGNTNYSQRSSNTNNVKYVLLAASFVQVVASVLRILFGTQ